MAALALIALLLAACGPRPHVARVSLETRGGKTVVLVEVGNRGGEGEVAVSARLRERRGGRVFAREQGLPMRPGKDATAAISFDVPPGDYEPEADVQYPP